MGKTYDLDLDTFEYEEDVELGTIQMEQVENSNKVIVELFPNNQSKESFENAEFSQVYDLFELAPCCLKAYDNINHPLPVGTTKEQRDEVNRAILRGVESMLETTLNLYDLRELPVYPVIETIRRNYLITEIMSFITYRATEPIDIEDIVALKTGHLANTLKLIDTINETDEVRTQHVIEYLKRK